MLPVKPQPFEMFIYPTVSCLVSALAIAVMLGLKPSLPLDHPNDRSLHETPTPRTGGLAIMLGSGIGWALIWPPSELIPMLVLALALSGFCFFDDLWGLTRTFRFIVHLAVAALLIGLSRNNLENGIQIAVAVLAVVWMTNLYNFMDGADGLAGGMATIGFGIYALAGFQGGKPELASIATCIATASAGFLWFNFSPARIFMGDAGSVPLGFLASAIGIAGWQYGLWPITFPILLFSPFIVDASVTMANRALRGDKFWQAHRDHYYQRLIRMGLGHRNTSLLEYGLMLTCGVSAYAIRDSSLNIQMYVIFGWAITYGCLIYLIDKAWKSYSKEPTEI